MKRDLKFFFDPKAIAVVGATAHDNRGGNILLENLTLGYEGAIYTVNPKYNTIMDITTYPTISAIDGIVDLALLFIPAKKTPSVLREYVAKGIKGVILENGGFAEVGPEGKALQDECIAIAKHGKLRLWGPNCMGLIDAKNQYVFSFMTPSLWHGLLKSGGISLIVQSGLLSAGLLSTIMSHKTLGLAKVCSIGNKCDITEIDILEFLLDDPDTKIIALYLESLSNGRRFFELAKSSSKPFVLLKGGKSEAGAMAAVSHTASLAGNYQILHGAIKQAGVLEANDFFEMMDIAQVLEKGFVHRNNASKAGRVAILTYSGASGIVTTDYLEKYGLDLAALSPATIKRLERLSPDWMPIRNPVDYWPAMEKNGPIVALKEGLSALYADPNVDGVIINLFAGMGAWSFDPLELMAVIKDRKKPIFTWLIGLKDVLESAKIRMEKAGWPVFNEIHRLVTIMSTVLQQR
ncbi:MAG: CoA-binding protein [Deltaproteobacteria bacterium]|nr:CoA-binding protein [Deltaproteobacteria bacterium]